MKPSQATKPPSTPKEWITLAGSPNNLGDALLRSGVVVKES